MGKIGSETKAIQHFESVLQIDPGSKNRKNIMMWLADLKKRHQQRQKKLMASLQKLKKFIKENPKHYSVGLKKKQIEIITSQIERNTIK